MSTIPSEPLHGRLTQPSTASQPPEKISKQQQNIAILAASEKVALKSNNDTLSLLYKTALEGINKELEPTLGKNAAQKAYQSGIDTSPEATAERIVSFATSLFSIYQKQHGAEDTTQQLDDFLGVIGKGIEQGFADAKEILTGLKVFEGDVETGVADTYGLVMKGLQAFREKMLETLEQNKASAEE